jgi:predicted DNA-binding transcriptional regulator YafY
MADGATTKTTRLFLAKSMVSRAGGASLSELMEKCGVSRITVWRLLNELRAAGTPVDEEKRGERTFYMVPASSRGATITMTQFEMVGVAVAQQIARYLDGTPMFEGLDGVFAKIEAALKRPDMVSNLQRKIFDVNEGAMRFTKRDNANIQALIDALLRDHQVAVKHERVENGELEFRVDPYTLLFHKKGPYLVGKSHHAGHKGEVRKLAFDGIRSVRWCKGDSFEYPATYTPERHLRGAFGIVHGEPVAIRVRFRKEVLRAVKRRRWHPTQKIGAVSEKEAWFAFEMKCTPSFEVQNWILSWGRNVEVLEPASLREWVKGEVAAMAGVYEGESSRPSVAPARAPRRAARGPGMPADGP